MIITNDGHVGIGLTNPAYDLDVKGTGHFETGEDDNAFSVFNGPNGVFQFRVDGGNNQTLLQESGGRVGIGTTNPLINLDVVQSQNAGTGFYVENPNMGTAALSAFFIGNSPGTPYDGIFAEHYGTNFTTAGLRMASRSCIMSGNGSTNGFILGTGNATAPLILFTGGRSAGKERLTILSSGNIGIGTTTPASLLSINGTMASSGGIVDLNVGTSFATNINSGTNTGTVTIGGTATPINIGTAGTGAVKIGGTGNQTIQIGNEVTGVHTISIGNSASTSSVGISGGSYGIIATTTGILNLIGGTSIDLNTSQTFPTNIGAGTSTGQITIGGTGNQTIDIGYQAGSPSGSKIIGIGSNVGAGSTSITAGSGGVVINQSNGTVTTDIATGTTSGRCTIGNTTAGMVVNVVSAVPGINVPFYTRLTGNVTTTQTTLQDITGLSIPLVANAVYEFEANLLVGSSAIDGCKYAVNYSVAGGATYYTYTGTYQGNVGATGSVSTVNGTTATMVAIANTTTAGILLKGIFITGVNAGNMVLRHLKVSSGTSSVYTGSYFKVTRIS